MLKIVYVKNLIIFITIIFIWFGCLLTNLFHANTVLGIPLIVKTSTSISDLPFTINTTMLVVRCPSVSNWTREVIYSKQFNYTSYCLSFPKECQSFSNETIIY